MSGLIPPLDCVEPLEASAMSDCDCHAASQVVQRRTLGLLLMVNAGMFVVESVAGAIAHSTALLADSLDMFADAMVYGLSLYAVGQSSQRQTHAACLSGLFQVTLAGFMLAEVVRRWFVGREPLSSLMIGMGLMALMANLYCLATIAKHRRGEIHMRASWIFSRNDVIANLSVIVSGLLVWLFHSQIPDLVVGCAIAALVLRGGITILQDVRRV